MKKSASKNPTTQPKAVEKQSTNSDPVSMVQLRGEIISEYNQSIRNFNETHK